MYSHFPSARKYPQVGPHSNPESLFPLSDALPTELSGRHPNKYFCLHGNITTQMNYLLII